MFQKTTAYKKIKRLNKRIRALQGGTSASKTVSTILYLIASAQCDTKPTLTSIVSESFPHLRRGVLRDFEAIMKTHGYFKDKLWDKTNSVYTFETGSKIEFFSVDQPEKVRGARRDRLFINEANNIPFNAFEELEVRTKEYIFLDWNPTNEFWFYEFVEQRTDCEKIILTYKDNESLDKAIVDSIEQRIPRTNWFKVYGLGQLGEVDGKIYRDWQILDEVPHIGFLRVRGLDFGYTNDPSALVDIYEKEKGFVWDETLFQKGLSNKQIADAVKNLPRPETLIIADSSEPKSIDELKSYGLNIIGAEKGPDSVMNGIQLVQSNPHWVTKRSINIIKEYRNYLFITDKDGKILNEPEHTYSHSMDGGRYGETGILKKPKVNMTASPLATPYYGDRDLSL